MIKKSLCAVLALSLVAPFSFADDRGSFSDYDAGPDVSTKAGYTFAKIIANTPNFRQLGMKALNSRRDKFKWKMGPMFYRGRTGADEVKVLVIGQEGAQDENASFRSFTGGTGGRMQHFLDRLGLNKSYLFVNTFVYTINGQYAEYAPTLFNGYIRWANNLTPGMIKLAQYEGSPIVDHRHDLLDHILRANEDSLKLVIAVGGAAQDSLATYISARGGTCPAYNSDSSKVQKLGYKSVWVEKNRYFFYPVDRKGRNLLLDRGEKLGGTFKWGDMKGQRIDLTNSRVQNELKRRANPYNSDSSRYKSFAKQILENVVKPKDGLGNGYIDMKQVGTQLIDYDRDGRVRGGCKVNGKYASLKGLKLPSNQYYNRTHYVNSDIRFIKLKHPGSNSPTLEGLFRGELERVRNWNRANNGWNLKADRGAYQNFANGYSYSHKGVPRNDFRFGLPEVIGEGGTATTRKNSGTNRAGKNAALEIGGRRTGARYNPVFDAYTPSSSYVNKDVPWEPNKTEFTDFDYGPGYKWAKLFTSVPRSVQNSRINPLHSSNYGAKVVYRGRPDSAKFLIVADQFSHDDIWTGRALTGLEGQKLQALLKVMGAGDDYVIIRTLPVNTLDANKNQLEYGKMQQLIEITSNWRKEILNDIVKANRGQLKAVMTLGKYADQVVGEELKTRLPVVSLSESYAAGLNDLREENVVRTRFNASDLRPIPINRKDIPYGLPRWVGTSGDRVTTAKGSKAGKFYTVNAPEWSYTMKAKPLSSKERAALKRLGL